MFLLGLLSGILALGAGFGYVSALVRDDEVRSKEYILERISENIITGFVYFNDDTVVGQLRSDEDRRLATMSEIPTLLKDAFIATEDRNFDNHYGVDLQGFMRAVKQKLLKEDVQTGGSTITQQLARRVFLSLEVSDTRKAKEILLALRLERLLSKDEILLAYLNKIPFGNGSSGYNVSGIKAAAKGIFDIDNLNDLHLAQMAYLAGLPQSPSNYSAFTSRGEFDPSAFSRAMNRQQLVLRYMLAAGKITEEEYEKALDFDVKESLAPTQQKAYTTYPYLMLEAERRAAEIFLSIQNPKMTKSDPGYNQALREARDNLLQNGYKIYTTIDKTLYDAMREIAENPDHYAPDHPTKGVEQVAAIVIDNKTGAILSMMEGRSFFIEQMNYATQMLRQPGSTMKPLAAFVPAIESGALQPGSVVDDYPVILQHGGTGIHIPDNWNLQYNGLMTARTALNQSYNIPAIRLFLDVVGIHEAWDFVKKLGITSIHEEDYLAQTGVIGGLKYGVSVEEITNAYASIANQGIYNPTYFIRKIEDPHGRVIYSHTLKPVSVFSEETAYLTTDMMRTVITSGTATDLMSKFKHYSTIPVVGKTGSTQSDADAWFVGYSPDISVGVWSGYEEQRFVLEGTQRQHAKDIWAHIMNAAVDLTPQYFRTPAFERPAGLVNMTVSRLSGDLPSPLIIEKGLTVTDLFNAEHIPTDEDDSLVTMKAVKYDRMYYIPDPRTPADMLVEKEFIRSDKSMTELKRELEAVYDRLPASKKRNRDGSVRTVYHFLPNGWEQRAPTEPDPRADDGLDPERPGGFHLSQIIDNHYELSFEASASDDVVGYRLYRSVNGGPFNLMHGKVIHTGDPTRFYDPVTPGALFGYYITAVDVAGRESAPSSVVYSNGSSGTVGNGNSGSSENSEPNHAAEGAPSTPENVRISTRFAGIGISISWRANPSREAVKEYKIYYSDNEDGPYRLIGTSQSAEMQYISLQLDGWYRVAAVNNQGESPPSRSIRYESGE